MTMILQFTCHALVAVALFLQPSPGNLEGRWVFQALSDTRKIPLFIAEISSSPEGLGGKVISTTAPFKLEIQKIVLTEGKITFEILADGHPLVLEGLLEGEVIRGNVAGRVLSGKGFIAEKTTLAELKKPVQPTPEELEAFEEASQKEDPKEQIVSLNAFLGAHSQSALKPAALMLLFHASLEDKRDDETLKKAAEQALESAADKSPVLNDFAYALAESGRLLDLAEQYARSAVGQAAEGSVTKANFLDTLGWVLYKKGNTAEAEKELGGALSLAPRQADVATHLAQVRLSAGKTAEALQAYAQAYVAGDRSLRGKVEELFASEKGSLDGLHEYLDIQYAQLGPLFPAGRYTGQEPAGPVVAELFTGAHCPPCQAANYAFDGLMQHYPPSTLLTLEYHLHIPRPDPMTNPDSLARATYYAIRSAPTAIFGGARPQSGGGSSKMATTAFEMYREAIQSLLQNSSSVSVQLKIDADQETYRVSATVKDQPPAANSPGPTAARTLHVALVENTVHYTGSNGVHFHPNVVRKLLGGAAGTPVGGAKKGFEFRFTLPQIREELKKQLENLEEQSGLKFDGLDLNVTAEKMSIIAFVQENDGKQIVAATMAPLKK